MHTEKQKAYLERIENARKTISEAFARLSTALAKDDLSEGETQCLTIETAANWLFCEAQLLRGHCTVTKATLFEYASNAGKCLTCGEYLDANGDCNCDLASEVEA